MDATDEIAALDESAKRLRLYMAALSAVAEGRQTLSPNAAGRIRDEIARLTAELEAVKAERDKMHRLTPEDHDAIAFEAARLFRDWTRHRGPTQDIKPQDGLEYWTAVATWTLASARRGSSGSPLVSEIARLTAELTKARTEWDRAERACEQIAVRLNDRTAERDALAKALRWYASPEAWTTSEVEGPDGDYGRRASDALARLAP
jgi:uncharacterized small protein (DUF1192 family)